MAMVSRMPRKEDIIKSQIKRSASFTGGLEVSALAKLPVHQVSPTMNAASFYGSGISDLRACVVAQQRQLDGLVDKVSVLLSGMHAELVQDVHRSFEQDSALFDSKCVDLRRLDEKVESRLQDLRASEGEMRAWLQGELKSVNIRVTDELSSVRERLSHELAGVHSRLSYMEDVSASVTASAEHHRRSPPVGHVSTEILTKFAADIRSELQEELTRMADSVRGSFAQASEVDQVERIYGIEAEACEMHKQLAQLEANLQVQSASIELQAARLTQVQEQTAAAAGAAAIPPLPTSMAKDTPQVEAVAEHLEAAVLRMEGEVRRDLELRMSKVINNINDAVDELRKEVAETCLDQNKAWESTFMELRSEIFDELSKAQRDAKRSMHEDRDGTSSSAAVAWKQQVQELRRESELHITKAFNDLRSVSEDLREDVEMCLTQCKESQQQLKEFRHDVDMRQASTSRDVEVLEELRAAPRRLEVELRSVRKECTDTRLELQRQYKQLDVEVRSVLRNCEVEAAEKLQRCEAAANRCQQSADQAAKRVEAATEEIRAAPAQARPNPATSSSSQESEPPNDAWPHSHATAPTLEADPRLNGSVVAAVRATSGALGDLESRLAKQEQKAEDLETSQIALKGVVEGYFLEQKVTRSLAGLEATPSRAYASFRKT
mmetsp:Transcript_66754/g.159659  ORF Transcript_66754/g.159659 Transcript_66754/m.159659 type:complete len:664 (+) Transcript_66754:59-2050(+)